MPYKDPKQQKAAQKAWYEKNKELTYERTKTTREKRKEIIKKIKESSPCLDFNISYSYYIMHFDHLDFKTKIGKVSSLIQTKDIKSVLKEIEKCELLCANCHFIRTWKRQHGIYF